MSVDRPPGTFRLKVVAMVLIGGLLVIAARLVMIQGLQASRYKEIASAQRDETITITPRRGTIFDREGEILAISEDVTTIYATPYQVEDPVDAAGKIAAVLGEDPAVIRERLEAPGGFSYVARKVENGLATLIREMELPGIGFVEDSRRFYPMGQVASQTVGMVDIDNHGLVGIELYYEDLLGGIPGKIALEKDAAGVPIPGSEKMLERSSDGEDVQLTIDRDIQSFTEEALAAAVSRYRAEAGSVIVLDCTSGEILAVASVPTFDPNNRADIDPEGMRNRSFTDIFEPGSVLKILSAAAALEEVVVQPDTAMFVPGELQVADQVFREARKKSARTLTFTEIICQSSNVGTIMVAEELGAARLNEYLRRFGMGRRAGVDFPGEVAGLLPDIENWSGTSTATISIGQGISITLVQLACMAGTVANGGKRVYPHLAKTRINTDGPRDMGLGGLGEQVVSEQTCTQLTSILTGVAMPDATGEKAALANYSVAGKTGTASKPLTDGRGYGKGYMATFVGFAPAERPRLVVAVVLDEPTPIWGGETSAPLFGEVMGYSLQRLKVPTGRAP